MANSVRIGGARVDLTGQDAQFQTVMKRAGTAFAKQERALGKLRKQARLYNSTVGKLTKSLSALAAGAGLGALAQATSAAAKESANYGSSLVEVSARIGTTVEDLQVLRRVFEGDGVAAQKFDQIMSALVRRFSANSPALQKAIERVGISLDEWYATGGDVAKMLPLLARGMEQSTSQADRLNLAQEAFSSSGRAAAVILQQGEEALAANAEAMRALGIVTADEAQRLKDFGQELANLRTQELTKQAKAIAGNTDQFLRHAQAVSNLRQAFSDLIIEMAPVTEFLGDLLKDFAADVAYIGTVSSAVTKFLQADVLDIVTAWRTMREEVDAAAAAYAEATAGLYAARGAGGAGLSRPPDEGGGGTTTQPTVAVTGLPDSVVAQAAAYRMEVEEAIAARTRLHQRIVQGAAREAEAERMKAEAVQKEISRLEELALIYEKIAAKEEERVRVEAERLQRIADEQAALWKPVGDAIRTGLVQGLSAAVTEAGSLKDVMRGVVNTIIQAVAQAVILQSLMRVAGGGGPLGGIASFLLGGTGLASGGTIRRGGLVRVHAGETIALPQNAQVFPRAAGGMGGGGTTVHLSFGSVVNTVQSSDGPGVRAALAEALPAVSNAITANVVQSLSRASQNRQAVFGR